MCGIYGLLSSSAPDDARIPEDFFQRVEALLKTPPGESHLEDSGSVDLLEGIRQSAYAFVQLEGFIATSRDSAIATRLAGARDQLGSWLGGLESHADSGALRDQSEVERLNQLIVGTRDLIWQIDRDVLANLEPVRDLLREKAGNDVSNRLWAHGWTLNLVLNNIDRLEVRGRDSAGVAVYVHFPDGGALNAFLSGGVDSDELSRRMELGTLSSLAVIRPGTSERTLLFAYKVANEVGEMGDNVRTLRNAIATDAIFQRALRENNIEIQVLAHTRWASNGIVSIPNCHPVDSTIFSDTTPLDGSQGSIVAVLNGDIDNYQELFKEYVNDSNLRVEDGITTDAKIIPIVIGHHYRQTGNLEEAFRRAFDLFEGSMAIGVMAADRPGQLLFGQKGSGQGLYLGLTPEATAIASEMYGVVELTQTYVKANGEHVEGGEIFRITHGDPQIALLDESKVVEVSGDRVSQAEITTRDINRGDFPRFLLKEISESVETVRKTLRGRYEIDGDGKPRFLLGPEVLDPAKVEEFRSGKIHRIICTGQGTAAIASDGIAHLLERALRDAPQPVQVRSLKATELSGHYLRRDMSETLIIAVSQSGTTTDTNRTVDMATKRGAWVIGIVNRRNSDLVYKSHGVLYTSDGRDIEMSVASTKAFYAQNASGQILALALASAVGAMGESALVKELKALDALPAALEGTLAQSDTIKRFAVELAPRRRYWALVGSGPEKIAANEIRIKLSELCYKSIASDFTEDKKHIDLSSEPLVIVCANGIPKANISDVVKEVAIFKAHQSLPIVFTNEGEDRFDPYARGVVKVPVYKGALNFLLSTMSGHLFGYHAASAFDALANRLRRVRTGLISELEAVERESREQGLEIRPQMPGLSDELLSEIREFEALVLDGDVDSCLNPANSVRLSTAFQVLLGRIRPAVSRSLLAQADSEVGFMELIIQVLSEAISELARPIDAIKHQAKTVTVGISRTEELQLEGALWSAFDDFELDSSLVSPTHQTFISTFENLVASVEGVTVYQVDDLDAVGRPREGSAIQTTHRSGVSQGIPSRCENQVPLAGTKWGVVRNREIYLGYGKNDDKKILIVPIIGEASSGHLVLYHLRLTEECNHAKRLQALAALPKRLEQLRIAVTERNQDWDPSLLESIENDSLFFADPEKVAEEAMTNRSTG